MISIRDVHFPIPLYRYKRPKKFHSIDPRSPKVDDAGENFTTKVDTATGSIIVDKTTKKIGKMIDKIGKMIDKIGKMIDKIGKIANIKSKMANHV